MGIWYVSICNDCGERTLCHSRWSNDWNRCRACFTRPRPRSAFDLTWWERLVAWFRPVEVRVRPTRVRLVPVPQSGDGLPHWIDNDLRRRICTGQVAVQGCNLCELTAVIPVEPRYSIASRAQEALDWHMREAHPRGGLSARTTRGEPDPFERAGVKPQFVQQATGRVPVPPPCGSGIRPPPAPTPMPGPGRKVSQ